jgi:hypothetical protein
LTNGRVRARAAKADGLASTAGVASEGGARVAKVSRTSGKSFTHSPFPRIAVNRYAEKTDHLRRYADAVIASVR